MIEIHAFDTRKRKAKMPSRAQSAMRARAPRARRSRCPAARRARSLHTLSHAALDWSRRRRDAGRRRWCRRTMQPATRSSCDTLLHRAALPLPARRHARALDARRERERRLPRAERRGARHGEDAIPRRSSPMRPNGITRSRRPSVSSPSIPARALSARCSRVDRFPADRGRTQARCSTPRPHRCRNAISQLANDKGTQLDVYWCAVGRQHAEPAPARGRRRRASRWKAARSRRFASIPAPTIRRSPTRSASI